MIRYREEEIACLRKSKVAESHSYCFILDVEFESHTFLYSGLLFPICSLEMENQCEEFYFARLFFWEYYTEIVMTWNNYGKLLNVRKSRM